MGFVHVQVVIKRNCPRAAKLPAQQSAADSAILQLSTYAF
jgi:hypothetical protein